MNKLFKNVINLSVKKIYIFVFIYLIVQSMLSASVITNFALETSAGSLMEYDFGQKTKEMDNDIGVKIENIEANNHSIILPFDFRLGDKAINKIHFSVASEELRAFYSDDSFAFYLYIYGLKSTNYKNRIITDIYKKLYFDDDDRVIAVKYTYKLLNSSSECKSKISSGCKSTISFKFIHDKDSNTDIFEFSVVDTEEMQSEEKKICLLSLALPQNLGTNYLEINKVYYFAPENAWPKPISVNVHNDNKKEGSASINPVSNDYNDGDIITISATPNTSYEFVKWEGVQENNTANPLIITLASDINIKPVFEKKSYAVTLNVGSFGSVQVDNDVIYGPGLYELPYSAFDTPVFIAIPNKGYLMNRWTGGVPSGQENNKTLIFDELTASNALNISFNQKIDNNGEWTVDSSSDGEVIVDPVTGITELRGDGFDSAYTLTPENVPVLNKSLVEFRVKFDGQYQIYFHCTTNMGEKSISYSGDSEGYYVEDSDYGIVYGLGGETMNNEWMVQNRDLNADLQTALGYPELRVESIDKIIVRGNGFIDYFKFLCGDTDTDKDGLSDIFEKNVSLTDMNEQDSDNDGIFDADEDFDNDGISNMEEFERGTDPYNVKPNIGETENTYFWEIYGGKEFSSVEVVVDSADSDNEVVKLSGQGFASSYVFYPESDISGMTKAEWKMRFNESYKIHFHCMTSEGWRYISYTADEVSAPAGDGIEIVTGLGKSTKSGHWLTVRRDLQADLSAAQPGNKILYIDFFNVRGSGLIDDICFFDSNIWEDSDNDGLPDDYETTILLTDPLRKDSNLDGVFDGDEDFDNDGISNYQEFLDATDPYDIKANIGETEEIKHWEIYGGEEFSSVETVIDPTNFENEVVKLSGQGFASSYVFYPESDISGMTKAEWKMRFNESNKIHFHCMTSEGWRYISYTADEVSAPAGDGIEIVTGLGKNAKNGHWLTVRRDLQADLSAAQPGNKILYVDFFNVRGSGLIDDICFF